MSIAGAAVLYAMVWFMCLLVAFQIRITSQSEAGKVEPGTPPSAPANINIRKRMVWVTGVAFILWVLICLVIIYGGISIQDIDIFGRYGDGSY